MYYMIKGLLGTGVTILILILLLVIGPVDFKDPMASIQSTNVYGYGGYVQLIQPCHSDWKCSVWSECYGDGSRSRLCEDLNQCGSDDRPSTTESCIPNEFKAEPVESEIVAEKAQLTSDSSTANKDTAKKSNSVDNAGKPTKDLITGQVISEGKEIGTKSSLNLNIFQRIWAWLKSLFA